METKLYTYRYLLRLKGEDDNDDAVSYCIETRTLAAHDDLCKRISDDEKVIGCMREYLGEIDLDLSMKAETIKAMPKKEENQ